MAGEIELPASTYHISTRRLIFRLAEQAAMWLVGFGLVLFHTPMTFVIGVALLGIVYARNLEFVHECLHGTAVPSARANRLIGQVLALPMLVSFQRWRYEHARHHRDVRIEGFRYEYDRLKNLRELTIHVLMLRHFFDAAASMLRALHRPSGVFPSRLAGRVRRDYLAIGAVLLAAAIVSIAFKTWLPIWLWIVPLPVAAIVHTHIELPEHLGLQQHADALRNSRIIRTDPFWEWFVNANNYHAIHHWNARIPMANVPQACRSIVSTIRSERYGDFFATFYKGLLHTK